MEEESQFGFSEIWAVAKRRRWWILIPSILCPIFGIGLTYVIKPVYTSKAFVLIEQPKVSEKFVTQVNTDQLDARLMTLREQILSRSRLEPIVVRLGLYQGSSSGMSMEEKIEKLHKAITVKMIAPEGAARVPSGFYITATAESAQKAQQICTDILSMFMEENVKLRQKRAAGTTEFLSEQLRESKRKLDEHDAQLAEFKGKYLGQLPSDEQRNLELLTSTRARLEALNQALSQAQQQKIIEESALSQLTSRRVAPTEADPTDVQKELTNLRSQLASLQSRYTDQHPEITKIKAQIQLLQNEMRASSNSPSPAPAKDDVIVDSPEARQLRIALRVTEENIRSKLAEQAKVEGQVRTLQSRLQLSPIVEERYKALTRDHDTALQFYNELLSKKTQSEMSTDLERRQEGEQFGVMDAPSLPNKPSFPERIKFGLAGAGAGLLLGIGLALLLERREQFIRNEEDVVRILDLPLLIGLPEVFAGPHVLDNGRNIIAASPHPPEPVGHLRAKV